MKIYVESIDHHIAACDGEWWKRGYQTLSFVYAHGRLQDEAGFDLVAISDKDAYDLTVPRSEDVVAVLPDGREIPARLYTWWIPASPRGGSAYSTGLLVAKDDIDADKYAKRRFDAREDFP